MSEFRRLLLAMALGSLPALSAPLDENALVIRASGFKHERGHAIAKVFQVGDDVLRHGRWQVRATIQNGRAAFQVPGLAAGAYAVVVFHDENDNGEIDHYVIGLPKEPLGFSNGFSMSLTSGKPTFEKLRFDHALGSQGIDVVVK
ncbi:MAG: DUF2141 domain-containing protein [Acidobacteria bacterium]|nr:DUF2141 domain-containing protein [Acidobacteriota bacterium]MBI3487160.1 DUF2141 domain-containing protein [Acidobacteriota bacterium]